MQKYGRTKTGFFPSVFILAGGNGIPCGGSAMGERDRGQGKGRTRATELDKRLLQPAAALPGGCC